MGEWGSGEMKNSGDGKRATPKVFSMWGVFQKWWGCLRLRPDLCGLISLFIALIILLDSASGCMAAEKPERRLLPYKEAEGRPYETKIHWVSPTLLLFNTVKDAYAEAGRTKTIYEKSGSFETYLSDKFFEVLLFDIETGKTTHHRDGMLVGSKDGNLTIKLKTIRQKGRMGYQPERDGEYDVQLRGSFGKEQQVTIRTPEKLGPIAKCPSDPGPPPPKAIHYMLRPEHGCLQYPGDNDNKNDHWVYFRSDGKRIELDVPKIDMWAGKRIPWFGVYMAKDSIGKVTSTDGDRSKTVTMMKPDGTLLTIPMNDFNWYNARPTRAGMIASKVFFKQSPELDGMYLLRGNDLIQIVKGIVAVNVLEVSPDGCHVAFSWTWRGASNRDYKIRVIDVCRDLGVSPDANPFNTSLYTWK